MHNSTSNRADLYVTEVEAAALGEPVEHHLVLLGLLVVVWTHLRIRGIRVGSALILVMSDWMR